MGTHHCVDAGHKDSKNFAGVARHNLKEDIHYCLAYQLGIEAEVVQRGTQHKGALQHTLGGMRECDLDSQLGTTRIKMILLVHHWKVGIVGVALTDSDRD